MEKRGLMKFVVVFFLVGIMFFSTEVLANSALELDDDGYYKIHNCSELQNMSLNLSANYKLINDVDCSDTINWNSGVGFVPIGTSASPFTGNFNGNNKIIINFYINRSGSDYQGLFGRIDGNASGLGLINLTIYGRDSIGGLAGRIYGSVSNCYAIGKVSGENYVGGFTGGVYSPGIVNNSYSIVNVTRISGTDTYFGGFAGRINQAKLLNSFSTGYVKNSTGQSFGNSYGFTGNIVTGGNYFMSKNYWDNETSEQSGSAGSTSGGSELPFEKSTSDMKKISTFSFWNIASSEEDLNNGYPYLGWQSNNETFIWLIPDDSDHLSPLILIISPTNTTYTNATMLLNISSDGDNIWYNWNGTNITYTTPINITFNEGTNILHAWANDTAGNKNYTNVSFSIDASTTNFNASYLWCGLHAYHTLFSDGEMTPEEAINSVKQYYDCSGTNDHDYSLNQTEWDYWINASNEHNTNGSFSFFFGTEWSHWSADQHIYWISLNPPSEILSSLDDPYDTVSELSSWLSSNQGLGQHAHPADSNTVTNTDFTDSSNYNETWIPLVEMINNGDYHWNYYWNCSDGSGCTTYENPEKRTNMQNASGTGWVKVALDNGLHFGFSCGFDDHTALPFTDPCYTGIANQQNLTREDIYSSLKNRHTWASESKTVLDVRINVDGISYIMGDIFNFSSSLPQLTINYSVSASSAKTISNISLFYNGIIVNVTRFSGNQNVTGSFTQNFTDGEEDYIFIEVIQNDGKRAWSSPFYVTYNLEVLPSLEIISPTNTTYTNATILLNISSDGDNVWYNWNGTNITYTTPINITFNEGTNILHAWANDSLGNLNSTNITFIISTSSEEEEEITAPSLGGGLPTYTITESKLQEGYSKVLGKNWKLKFKLHNETHELNVNEIDPKNNKIKITISSDPINFELLVNETRKVDINNDNYYDLSVFLEYIKSYRANLIIKEINESILIVDKEVTQNNLELNESINEEIPKNQLNRTEEDNNIDEEENQQEKEIKETISENIKDNKVIYSIIGIILFVSAITILVLKFKPKKKIK